MFKRYLGLLTFMGITFITQAQIKSPEEFLGYKVGTRFTPHWKIVNYFNEVAAHANGQMKLVQFGQTNEGRPLLLAFISSPENMQRLEAIRLNNIRLANLSRDKMATVENDAPVIVWLSYNVHGNEASSSEASLLTLYALLDPSNAQAKSWLKNTVVIIDPCVNPDGRDRYVNWYNGIVGKNYNPQMMAREHREPWPGGRTNHYNFDLNRDWAWQEQIESQQRVKMYLQWLPQVHVDYHEQGVNEPYYFAPAVQPYHEVITPWQREFQVTIGKNNAKYFDKNGWLFFTKEVFDLFYPSYGDTYPTYNGSIGMTYEQGGGPAGGLGANTDESDTLTLVDRATHHFTTSLSTIEISSLNASKLITEFRKFFSEGVANGSGEFKTYVIKNDPKDADRLMALLELLDKNEIQYGTGAGPGKGFNYNSGKEENFTMNSGDILVSAYQPRANMVKVLFEPKSKLVDSLTYDIVAWSLPYVYGLKAYGSRDKLAVNPFTTKSRVANPETEYGYVFAWTGVRAAKLAADLLQKGILLRYAEQPFEVAGNKFDRGAIIILKTANKRFGKELWTEVKESADSANIQLYPVSSGFVDKGYDFGSDKVHPFKAPKVALATGEGVSSSAAGEIWHFFEQQLNYPITLVNANDLTRIKLNEIDVLILPDGNYRVLNDKSGADQLRSWVIGGGRLVALEGAVQQLSKADFGIKEKKPDDSNENKAAKDSIYAPLKKYGDREREAVSEGLPGAILKVNMDNSHPLAFGYPDYYYTLKQDDHIYEFIKNDGWNVGVVKKASQVAGFVGSKLRTKIEDGLLFGVQEIGNGTVTYLADDVIFRSFWENGKLLICNSVFLVGQ